MINEQQKKSKDIIAIDFDGVIHSYKQGWTGDVPEDPPMEGVEESLQKLKDDGWSLVILSTRKKNFIKDWLKKYNLDHFFDGVHNTKIPAKLYIDDRGFRFENWNDTLNFIKNTNLS